MSYLSKEAITRMDGLSPMKELSSYKESIQVIGKALSEEGFERDEIENFLILLLMKETKSLE